MVQGISSNFTDPQVRLQDATINQPQAFVASTEKPAAASGVQGDSFEGKKKGKGGKVFAGILIAAAAVATTLGLLASKGKFKAWSSTMNNQTIKNAIGKLDDAGQWISAKATSLYGSAAEFIQKHKKSAQEAAQNVTEGAAEAAQQV